MVCIQNSTIQLNFSERQFGNRCVPFHPFRIEWKRERAGKRWKKCQKSIKLHQQTHSRISSAIILLKQKPIQTSLAFLPNEMQMIEEREVFGWIVSISSCVWLFSALEEKKDPIFFIHSIVWCEIRFKQTSSRRREMKKKHMQNNIRSLCWRMSFNAHGFCNSDITKGAHFQFHTQTHTLNGLSTFIHSFFYVFPQTMNLMSRFNDEEGRKKEKKGISCTFFPSLVTHEISFSLSSYVFGIQRYCRK